MTVSGLTRHYLLDILPDDGAGSLKESRHINTLRQTLSLDPEELSALSERTDDNGGIQKAALQEELGEVALDLSDAKRETIASCFLRWEAQNKGEIPTDDAFVRLIEQFSDTIEQVR